MLKRVLLIATLACGILSDSSVSQAQLEEIDWGGSTGNQDWHTGGNWVGGVVPNDSLKIADLSVNLGSGLTVDLGATDTTIARLRLGSTSGGVTTNVTSTGIGRLLFDNDDEDVITPTEDADFDNNTRVDGRDFLIWQRGFGTTGGVNINGQGDANNDGNVDAVDLGIWQGQYGLGAGVFTPGSPGIESTGVAGVTNIISAPIHLANVQVEIGGTRGLAIDGNITYEGNPDNANISNSGIRAMSAGQTVTINSAFTILNTDAADAVDFYFNNHGEAQGTIVIEGVLSGDGAVLFGKTENTGGPTIGTVVLKQANTNSGSVIAGRGNLVLENANALGTGTYRQAGPANQFGYNLISNIDNINIPNAINFAQWQTIKGVNSIELSGEFSQTNNRGLVNLLPSGETLTLSGRLNIWEDEEELERRFVIDGSGRTIISGTVRNDPLDVGTIEDLRLITKTGTGSLLIDVDSGDNNHQGPELVIMGNLHYADNDSLNTYVNASIRTLGGAVGVDSHPVGQNLATNTAFLNQIDPTSTGGLMLSNSDTATNLDFTSGALANAANMSVAAPETNLSYTGTITPANNTYKMGGGTGTLTLPNAQLTGASSLEVKNGGTVRLLGDNNYTGATSIMTKYTTSRQAQAAVDEASDAPGNFYDTLVAPILEVDDLANGGVASSIGSSSSDAANLKIQGSTLRYVGTGDSTDRLFTLGTGGGTLDASGTGAVVFSNTGALAVPDAADITGTLDDFTANPNVIYNASNTSDVIVGMPVSDPDGGGTFTQPPCEPSGANCIPSGTTVTGINDSGTEIGISANYGFILKENTRIVFGAVDRTLTLTGSNTGANILSPVIANSPKGGAVDIVKQGAGTWLLEGVNTTTGVTTVEAGTLGGNGGVGGDLTVNGGATFAPGGTGGSAIGDFSVGGDFALNSGSILGIQLGGTTAGSYDVLNVTGSALLAGTVNLSTVSFTPAMGNQFTVLTADGGITDTGLAISGLTGFTKSIVGNTLVLTKTTALSALASVPEPSALVLLAVAAACCGWRRK